MYCPVGQCCGSAVMLYVTDVLIGCRPPLVTRSCRSTWRRLKSRRNNWRTRWVPVAPPRRLRDTADCIWLQHFNFLVLHKTDRWVFCRCPTWRTSTSSASCYSVKLSRRCVLTVLWSRPVAIREFYKKLPFFVHSQSAACSFPIVTIPIIYFCATNFPAKMFRGP